MRVLRKLMLLLCVFFTASFVVCTVSAAEFSKASLVFYRASVSQSNVQTLVVITPSSESLLRNETTVRVQFAAGYSVASLPGAIQTTVSGLPSTFQGVALTPMPGISATATNVNGQLVDFSVNNLSPGTAYAFYITTGITTPSSIGNYVHILSTRDGGGEIENQHIGTSVRNDHISVSAAVRPTATDGTLAISGNKSTAEDLAPLTTVTFTITYESHVTSAQPMTITASWDKALIDGSATNLVDAMEYVVGSATDTDDSTAPIINLIDRTIVWDIPAVQPSTQHTVMFSLKVLSLTSLAGSDLTQKIKVNGELLSVPLSEKSVTYTIAVPSSVSPTSTPQPGPTTTPQPQASLTTTPTVPAPNIQIESVGIPHIGIHTARIVARTSTAGTTTLFYGNSMRRLDTTISEAASSQSHIFELDDLIPGTQYYFRLVAEDGGGKSATSDIFTFRTPEFETLISVSQSTLLWKQLALGNTINKNNQELLLQRIFVPSTMPITFTVAFNNADKIASAIITMENAQVLGISTFIPQPKSVETALIEVIPGVFSGELAMPVHYGPYNAVIHLKDIYHGINDVRLPYIFNVGRHFQVNEKSNNAPIENALVKLYRYEESKKIYTLLESTISYQHYTNENGELDIVLPAGKYIAEISNVGYETLREAFTLEKEGDEYPIFKLARASGIDNIIALQSNLFTNVGLFMRRMMKNVALSPQAYRVLLSSGIFFTLIFIVLAEYAKHYHSQLIIVVKKRFIYWVLAQCIFVFATGIVWIEGVVVYAIWVLEPFSRALPHIGVSISLFCAWIALSYYIWRALQGRSL